MKKLANILGVSWNCALFWKLNRQISSMLQYYWNKRKTRLFGVIRASKDLLPHSFQLVFSIMVLKNWQSWEIFHLYPKRLHTNIFYEHFAQSRTFVSLYSSKIRILWKLLRKSSIQILRSYNKLFWNQTADVQNWLIKPIGKLYTFFFSKCEKYHLFYCII